MFRVLSVARVDQQLRGALLEGGKVMIEEADPGAVDTVLRQDFVTFAARCFRKLNPQAALAMNWHLEVIAAKLPAAGRAARRTRRPDRELEPELSLRQRLALNHKHDPD
jgi:hypothetical protein